MGTAIATLIPPQLAVSLSPADVNAIAKQIMVRIDGANTGTGVIVDRQNNNYTVLTNWHVVKEAGTYTIQTADGKTYQINSNQIQRLGNVDLAVLQFTSDRTYRVAQLGNSDKIPEGTTVYAAGWIAPDRTCLERCDRYPSGQLIGRLPKAKDGYSWIYTNPIKPGMSGGPVLDDEGRLVGINGLAIPDINTQQTDFFAIPIDTYAQLANVARTPTPPRTTLPSSPPASVTEPPRRTPAPSPQPTPTPSTDSVAYNSRGNFSLFKTLTGHSLSVESVAISPDGQTLVSGSWDKTIKIWDLSSGKLRRTITGHSSRVSSVAISPDGETLVSGQADTIKIWDLSSGKLRQTLTGHSGAVWSVAISPDGQTLASGSDDDTIKIWDIRSGKLRQTLTGHSNVVTSVTISPDGRTLVSGSWDKTIKIWDIRSGKLRQTLTGHSDLVWSVAISPDGRTLVSGSGDDTIKIWDLSSGELRQTLTGHSGWVNSVAISPDGRTLVIGGWDKTIKIWDLRSGELRQTLTGHSEQVNSVAISPDGRTLASGAGNLFIKKDTSIKIWRLAER